MGSSVWIETSCAEKLVATKKLMTAAAKREKVMGVAIVTGGSSGIGLQIVCDLIDEGYDVLIWDIKEPPAELNALFYKLDLTSAEEVSKACASISGPVDSFVHCAGVFQMTSICHDNLAVAAEFSFKIHCLAFVIGVQALLSHFNPEKASVVAITSAGASMVYPGTLAYGPSKAALQRSIEQLAVELGDRNIRVNGVCPGAIATDMTKHLWEDPEFSNKRLRHIPLGQQGRTHTVGDAVKFLISDAAAYVSGETIWVDGGVRHGIFQEGVREFRDSVGT